MIKLDNAYSLWQRLVAICLIVVLMMPMNVFGQKQKEQSTENSVPLKVLFIGDSITDGNRTRDNDWNHILGHGYVQMLAARLWFEQPQRFSMFYNRGISGNKVSDLAARWQTDVIDLHPDVVSILIGINDVFGIANGFLTESIDEYEITFRSILDITRDSLPNARLVICEPFVLDGSRTEVNSEVWKHETQLRQEVAKKLAKEYDAVFVPLQQSFIEALKKAPVTNWIWDGIHPMPAGHELIVREWLKATGY